LVLLGALALSAAEGLRLPPSAPLAPRVPLQSKPAKNKTSQNPAPGAALLAEDKGKFRILLEGQPVGTEEFDISQASGTWLARGKTEIHLPSGGTTQVSASLRLSPDGTPLGYEWSAQGQKKASATVEFQGGTAKMALQLEGSQPFIQELSFGTPRVVILDNNLYHHYAILARLYDWGAAGAQTFPVLIPQDMTPGSITVESAGSQEVDGASLEILRVRTADLELDLYLDASHRLVRLAAPASKAVVVRE